MNKNVDLKQCEKCETNLSDPLCPKCGNPKTLKRIDRSYIISEIASVLNFDKGIFYTIKELLIRPGEEIQKFIHRDRNKLVKPITFLILCSLVYTIARQVFNFEDNYVQFQDGYASTSGVKNSALSYIFGWVRNNYGYANILMSTFIAIWAKLLFKKYDYNFFEIMILLFFTMGMGTLIYTTFGIIESITTYEVLYIGGFIGFVYTSWAIGQFFNSTKKISYVKAFTAYVLGMLTFYVIIVFLGTGIDLLSIV